MRMRESESESEHWGGRGGGGGRQRGDPWKKVFSTRSYQDAQVTAVPHATRVEKKKGPRNTKKERKKK